MVAGSPQKPGKTDPQVEVEGQSHRSMQMLTKQLRDLGFSISLAEEIDAHALLCSAATLLELQLGLRMIFSKDLQQQILFDLVWTQLHAHIKAQTQFHTLDLPQQPSSPDSDDADIWDNLPLELNFEVGAEVEFCPNPMELTSGPVGSNDPSISLIRFSSKLKGAAKQAIQGNSRSAAAIVLRYMLAQSLSIAQIQAAQEQALLEVKEMLDYSVPAYSDALLARMERQLNELLGEQLSNPSYFTQTPLKAQNIEDLPLLQLRDSPELHLALKRLGKKLATRQKRKRKNGGKRINLRQTIRANIQHGGTMLKLVRQQPRLTRPRLVILTDVSSSTIHATKLFLSIIWHAREVFGDIRYFEFIGSMIETTAEFKRAKSVNEGIQSSLALWNREIEGKENSDYYRAFRTFESLMKGSTALSSQTTLIILGDLRDWLGPWTEAKPLSASVLAKLAKKVHRIMVLNPEVKGVWNSGDSIVQHVEAAGVEVFEATTLAKLIEIILEL